MTRTNRREDRRGIPATVFLVLLSAYCLFPLYWLVISSTKDGGSLFSSFALWFDEPQDLFTNIQAVVTYNNGIYGVWVRNTIIYALITGLGSTLVALLAGYAFSKFQFRGRGVLYLGVLGALLIPSTALAIPLYLFLSQIGLVGTIWAFVLPAMVNPLGVYLIQIYADTSIPKEILEASRVDGASEWRTLWTIATPLLVPGIVTVFLFSVVATWNNYFLPLVVLNDPGLYPLTVGLASWNSQAGAGGGAQLLFPLVITGSLMALIPLIALFLFLQRYWQASLSLGAVK